MHKPELLAPAGSKEALIAAVENGADAVYFGGTAFSARQYASNFKHSELEWAIDYAHVHGVLAYVAVNTLVKDPELEKVCEYLQFLCNCGTDAIIVQDLGILRLLREQLPELPVHASTQMTIHNIEGVKFLQDMGVKRVVLARELSLDELCRIKSQTSIELETFIHGALCFSYSGHCLLSSMIGGRSGNRGYCAQPCRKRYSISVNSMKPMHSAHFTGFSNNEGYLLSPKDLNMSEHIGALIELGIDSFKIEGRMKRPEYVAGVVRVYRKLIDRYLDAPSNFAVSDEERYTLLQLFNREFTAGYFFGNPGSELMSRSYPNNRGTVLGRVVDYDPRKKQVSIFLKAPLMTGDGIGLDGRETGVIVRSMYIGTKRTDSADAGSTVKIPLDREVRTGGTVFRTLDSQLMASLKMNNVKKKIPIEMAITARIGEHAELCVSDGENRIKVRGGIVSRAGSRPISERSIAEQLRKLGNTIFESSKITYEIEDNIFIPVSELNSLRREAIAQLERARSFKWKRKCKRPGLPVEKTKSEFMPGLSVNTCSIESLKAAIDNGADIVYIGSFENELGKDDYDYAVEYGTKKGVPVFFDTPKIIKDINLSYDSNPDGFLVSDPGLLYYLNRFAKDKPIIIDYPFNVLNRLTMEHLLNYSQRVTLSPELTLKEIRNIASCGPAECIVHGLFPLMVSEHGLLSSLFQDGNISKAVLKDEKGFAFPVITDRQQRTYIMNSRELCMIEYVPDIIKAGVNFLRIEAVAYDKETTAKITRAYRKALDGISGRCGGEHTTGHYFRGVL